MNVFKILPKLIPKNAPESIKELIERAFSKDLNEAQVALKQLEVKLNQINVANAEYVLEFKKLRDKGKLEDEALDRAEREADLEERNEARLQAKEQRLNSQEKRFQEAQHREVVDFRLALLRRVLELFPDEDLKAAVIVDPARFFSDPAKFFNGLTSSPGSPLLEEPDDEPAVDLVPKKPRARTADRFKPLDLAGQDDHEPEPLMQRMRDARETD